MPRQTITLKYGIKMKEPRKVPLWLKILLGLIFTGVVIYGTGKFVSWVFTPTDEDEMIITVTPYVYVTNTPTPDPTPTQRPKPTIKMDANSSLVTVKNINDYSAAWLSIPSVYINSVVMQYTDNDFYRQHDISQQENADGALFFDYRSDITYMYDTQNIVIHGYGDSDGRQLENLFKYQSERRFKEDYQIILSTMYGDYRFRIFSVHIVDNDTYYTSPVEKDDMPQFVDDCIQSSLFEAEEFPQNDATILTFTTDIISDEGERFLLHAFLED